MWQPESEAEVAAGGEGTSVSAVKRGLSLETAAAAGQDVKRFRTATGATATVSLICYPSVSCKITLSWFRYHVDHYLCYILRPPKFTIASESLTAVPVP